MTNDQRQEVRTCWQMMKLDTFAISHRLGVHEFEVEREIHEFMNEKIARRRIQE